jgi:hypothetical protein
MTRISSFVLSLIVLFAATAKASDCVGVWGDWLPCDGATCGGQSKQYRYYTVQIEAAGGQPCPAVNDQEEERACTVMCSDQNCVGAWQRGACKSDGKCGSDAGKATETFVVSKPQGPGGLACKAADGSVLQNGQTREVTCSAPIVPCQDCVGSFVDGPCVSDGVCNSNAGKMTQTYTITTQAETGGAACPHANGFKKTNVKCTAPVTPCQNCVGKWSAYTKCVSDGVCNSAAGKRSRTYTIVTPKEEGGQDCPHANGFVQESACECPNAEVTPCQNCEGSWSAYTTCKSNGKCGSSAGTRSRTFTVTKEAGEGGDACAKPNGFVETSACAAPVTPCQGCEGSWSDWSACKSDGVCSSDSGTRTRVFHVTKQGEPGGAKCEAKNGFVVKEQCSAPVTPCAPEDCVGTFGAFSHCKAVGCGTAQGTKSRSYTISKQAKFGGKECPHKAGFRETVDCECPTVEIQPCPVDGEGHWEAGPCVSAGKCSSDEGYITETYVVDVEAAHGGKKTPFKNGQKRKVRCSAPVTPCPPQHCVGSWKLGECQQSACGNAAGERTDVFKITKRARYGGKECLAKHGAKRVVDCECPTAEVRPCPVHCEGAWSAATKCKSAGKCSSAQGTSSRTYKIKVKAQHGGKACPHRDGEEATERCNDAPVTPCPPEDCVGKWVSRACIAPCGKTAGHQVEKFEISHQARYGGKVCEAAHGDKRTVPCTAKHVHCPVHCVGEYSAFTECKPLAECGSDAGRKSRTYTIKTPAAHGGRKCPRLDKQVETEDCKVPEGGWKPCPPVHCVGSWSAPTACEQTKCDATNGTNTQRFTVTVAAAHGGKECEARNGATRTNACHVAEETMKRCPVHCVGKWTDFTKCVPFECGCVAGKQQRTYRIETPAAFGGRLCPHDDESVHQRECDAKPEDVERCPNAYLDAPCVELDGVIGEAKNLRCKVEAVLAALESK